MKKKIGETIGKSKLGVVFTICFAMIITSAVPSIGSSFIPDNQTYLPIHLMSYSFEFKEPLLQSKQAFGSEFTTITMQGCQAAGKLAGNPKMPAKMIKLLLPPKTAVSDIRVAGTPVTVLLPSTDLIAKPVLPSQQSIVIGSEETPEFLMNANVYSADALYPSSTYSDVTVGYSQGYAILSFILNPMQYNPQQGTLVYYPTLTVTISLNEDDTMNQFFSNNPDDAAYVQSLVSNPNIADRYAVLDAPAFAYPGGLCEPGSHYDYVIVTTTANGLDYWDTGGSLTYNWDSLMEQHNGEGLSSTLVTVEDIVACDDYDGSSPLFNDEEAHVREFCKDAYEDWGTRYVLIAGDADTIPARQMHYAYEGNVDSDLYWSNLDNNFNADQDSQWGEAGDSGFDLYSEVFIGRVTCDVPQDVSNWLTKSLFYADSIDFDYLDNAAFYGGDTGWNCQGDDFIDYSAIYGMEDWGGPNPGANGPFPSWAGFQYGFETWNLVNPTNAFDISVRYTEEPPNPGWDGSGAVGFRNAINDDKVTLIAGIAHANNQMSLDVYDSEWESQYHNTRPFFIHDYGCHCGDFDDGDDGVIESMLFHSNIELAFACVYNTGYGWGQFDDTNSSSAFQQKAFWDYFFDTENNSGGYGNWQLGKGLAWSKDTMAPGIDYDYSSGTWRGVIECCLLFGDPAQAIKSPSPSDPPAQPTKPEGKTLVVWNRDYSYKSTTSDPNGDDIYYLFDWGDGSNSGWLGPYSSGQMGTGTHAWAELGTFSVTVKARDIWGAGSPISEALTVVVTDNTAPFDPTITGPSQIKPNIENTYIVSAVDEFDHDVEFDIDWGDGNGVAGIGPYKSGEEVEFTHTWAKKRTYDVRVRATDQFGLESNWTHLQIVCPMNYQFAMNTFLQHLFERFPNAFPILRHLMGY
jgi:hypothetical protein